MSGHIHSYGKIYNLGHYALDDLLNGPVVVEEKIDGSQFSFGRVDGVLLARSNGADLNVDAPEKMFERAIDTAKELFPILEPGCIYRGEYLQKPKHNTLCYNRIPAKHVIIFDVDEGNQSYMSPLSKKGECERIGLECVPEFLSDNFTLEQFKALLETESVLGGQKIEGVVIKNYERFGSDGKTLMGKYVSEEFKEIHRKDWKERNPCGLDIKEAISESLRTPARWNKAIQHLTERGELQNAPQDIGALLKEVNLDVLAECGEEIRQQLFKWAWPDISRQIIRGLPQWYKDRLAEKQFEPSVKIDTPAP